MFFSFVVTIVMLCPILTFAHSGGHYHHGDGTVYNTWQLKNGNPLKGNFLMNKGEVIYLEKEDGQLLAVPIQDLCLQDQKLANFKINKLNGINYSFENSTPSNTNSNVLISSQASIGKKYPANFAKPTATAAIVPVCITEKKLHPYKNPNKGLYASFR